MTDIVILTNGEVTKPVRKKCTELIEKLKSEGWTEEESSPNKKPGRPKSK